MNNVITHGNTKNLFPFACYIILLVVFFLCFGCGRNPFVDKDKGKFMVINKIKINETIASIYFDGKFFWAVQYKSYSCGSKILRYNSDFSLVQTNGFVDDGYPHSMAWGYVSGIVALDTNIWICNTDHRSTCVSLNSRESMVKLKHNYFDNIAFYGFTYYKGYFWALDFDNNLYQLTVAADNSMSIIGTTSLPSVPEMEIPSQTTPMIWINDLLYILIDTDEIISFKSEGSGYVIYKTYKNIFFSDANTTGIAWDGEYWYVSAGGGEIFRLFNGF